jgi:hypothetical protein
MPSVKRKKAAGPPDPGGSRRGAVVLSNAPSTAHLHAEDALEEEAQLRDPEGNALEADEAEADTVFSVVKMKLNTFVNSPSLRDKMRSIVHDMNVVMAEAYLFANFHVLRLLDAGVAPPMVDRNFYYRCLLAVSKNKCREGTLGADFAASVAAFDALRTPENAAKVDVTEYNQILADASVTMATMASNHLWVNLERRLSLFLSWRHPELNTGQLRKRVVVAVAENPKGRLDALFAPPDGAGDAARARWERARDIAERLRSLAPRTNNSKNAPQARLLLPLYRHLLRETVLASKRHAEAALPGKKRFRGRAFTLLPTKGSFTAGHVQFSKMALLGILKRLKLERFADDGRGLEDEALRAVWQRAFHVNAVETADRRFKGRLVTDGCAVSVVMTKRSAALCPTPPPNREALKALFSDPRASFVGVDPGVSDVVTVADRRSGEVRSYGAARYYQSAHYNTSRRRVERWNKETEAQAAGLEGGGRTADLAEFAAYARSYLAAVRPLTAHRMARGYRSMRFLRFVSRQKAVDEVCEVVAPRRRKGEEGTTVVGFGDWVGLGTGSPISRRCAGPLQAIKFQLSKRPDVVLVPVDEFRTSQTCSGCFGRLCNMRAAATTSLRVLDYRDYRDNRDNRDGRVERVVTHGARVHKVLHCKRSVRDGPQDRCRATWNRDVNASKNILMLLMLEVLGMERPAAFCREPDGKRKRPVAASGDAVKPKRSRKQ